MPIFNLSDQTDSISKLCSKLLRLVFVISAFINAHVEIPIGKKSLYSSTYHRHRQFETKNKLSICKDWFHGDDTERYQIIGI